MRYFLTLAVALVLNASATGQPTAAPDPLLESFRNPPNEARPRVWWHWLDGNITKDGIRKDLEWMKRSGIGGAQAFDGSFGSPQMVERRLAYMTPEWREAFRFAAAEAERLGLELAIAASPGWSQTGGPWVKPQDAMKKLVWSETIVRGGRGRIALPPPPRETGPYQDVADWTGQGPAPGLYGDIGAFAYRTAAVPPTRQAAVTLADGKPLDGSALMDGRFGKGAPVPRPNGTAPTAIILSYPAAQTIRSATLHIPGSADIFFGAFMGAVLEAETTRGWRKVSNIALNVVPTTVSFAPVTARRFRVVLSPLPITRNNNGPPEPGVEAASRTPSASMDVRELRLAGEARVNQAEVKAGFGVASDYYALDGDVRDDAAGVRPGDVVDLSGRLRPDGSLDWTPPAGMWRVVRLGYSLTGKTNHPATAEATGLEVDKLDAGAVRRYMQDYLALYRQSAGDGLIGARGLRAIVTDSSEVGAFNWTPGLFDRFRQLRGYDPQPWLPALTGAIVGSRSRTDKFLYDFRRTIGELHASEHYGTLAEEARRNGLKVYGESLEGWRTSLGDDVDMRRYADVPMAALWVFRASEGPRPFYLADMRGAASIAHQLGKTVVAVETLTSTQKPWAHAPSDLRRIIDLAFASGINLPIIHTSVHQPVDRQPGLSMRHIGQFFTRHETWAEMTRPWIDYIARSAHLLQQGRAVADVAYFYGEETPVGEQAQNGYFTDVPKRHGYDFISPSALLDLLSVKEGSLVTAGGARYRLLYLSGTSKRMTLPVLRKIATLVDAGATLVGEPPESSPSLADDAAAFAQLRRKLWPGASIAAVGKGRVIRGRNVDAALDRIGVAPDLTVRSRLADTQIRFAHRQLADGDIYFLNNAKNREEAAEVRLRVTGKAPEIWRADTGTAEPVSYRIENGETVVPLTFAAEDSYFLVLRKAATASSRTIVEPRLAIAASLDGSWNIRFQENRGAPVATTLLALRPLNEHQDPGIRYFSGVATYTRSFELPDELASGAPMLLDLGQVGDVAEVRINGRLVGTAWHAPYRLDVGPALRRGENRIEIRVANLWVNRLIGDRQPGAPRIAYTVSPMYRADAPLRPSGLIGPVRLMSTIR